MGAGFEVEEDEFGAMSTETRAGRVRHFFATVQHQLLDVAALLSECSGKWGKIDDALLLQLYFVRTTTLIIRKSRYIAP